MQSGILINSVTINTTSGAALIKAGTLITDSATLAAVVAAGGVLGNPADPLLLAAQTAVVKMRASRGQDEWLLNAIMGAAYGQSMGQSQPGAAEVKIVNLATAAALATNTYNASTQQLIATANGALTVDGVSVTAGMRLLVACEATASHNGIYDVIQPGTGSTPYILQRSRDASVSGDFQQGLPILVLAGSAQKNWIFQLTTTGAITLDTTNLTYFPILQYGTTTLVAGVSPSITAWITATSKVFCTRAALNASPALGFVGCDGGADLVAGTPGSFVIRSRTTTATAATTDVSSVNWYVLTD